MTAAVLVIEDHAAIAEGLRHNLEFEGYAVRVAGSAADGLTALRERPADLVILDLMLPDGDGFHVLRTLRAAGDATPVLVLTALGDESDKVRGLRLGADDYVTKPFGLLELLARVDALLRRAARPAAARERFGAVEVCAATHEVTRAGAPVALRPKEYELLLALLRRDGAVATRDELLREVWRYDASVTSRTVDTHVLELRRKLEDDPANPRHVLTVRKTGYRLQR
ncbi:response regulator transcription factor [Roseisolibacter sp. H3M3-2]|uniref:response regulator transcription factor n=1 Tax=Roseisolibacter sp. H3M3-2 TaxID=3031323 RepID=UPI0023DB700F|nr:response regulator transcription factor [Roseisolibacter sp. H3M3-2]MDF1503765.1 response regulator transcription factor [Roseisolibacter sp. H3M3-2]